MARLDDTYSDYERPGELAARSVPHLDLEIECERPLAGPARYRLADVPRVRLGRGEERSARVDKQSVVDFAIPDGWMSSHHAELFLGPAGWELVDLGSKNGTFRNGARIDSTPVGDGDRLQLGHTLFRLRVTMPIVGPAFVDTKDLPDQPPGLRTMSRAFAEVVADARAVAAARAPVLIIGESGTGKELLAQAIHTLSGRGPSFVAVNCGGIPHQLVESELFGHKKGAFSGAHADRVGLVRESDGGTLFLDEIGDLPLSAQATLLRVLQENQVMPVGSDRPVSVDLRVVSATHKQLGNMVREGTFRNDLLARLDGVRLQIPPLRERREDLPLLIATLLAKLAPDRREVKLEPDAAQALLDYHWPLNVRELEHALQGALARSGGRAIGRSDLPRTVGEPGPAVARAMGKHRTQVLRWMERYGLDANKFRT